MSGRSLYMDEETRPENDTDAMSAASELEWFRCRLCGRWYEAIEQMSCPDCPPQGEADE